MLYATRDILLFENELCGGCVLAMGEFGGLLKTHLTISPNRHLRFPQTVCIFKALLFFLQTDQEV